MKIKLKLSKIDELCIKCGDETVLWNVGIQRCENCGESILPCSACICLNCTQCIYEKYKIIIRKRKMRRDVDEIIKLCLDSNKKGLNTFFDFSGHVQAFNVRVYEGGWVRFGDPDFTETLFLDRNYNSKTAVKIKTYLKNLIKEEKIKCQN